MFELASRTRSWWIVFTVAAALCTPAAGAAEAAGGGEEGAAEPAMCGPQSPRDIAKAGGTNRLPVPGDGTRPPRLCNMHFHRPAEHTGIGACPAVAAETPAGGVCGGEGHEPVRAGDEIEVHWVYTNCPAYDVPRPGLDNCVCDEPPRVVLMAFGQKYVVAEEGAPGADRELREPTADVARYGGSTTGPKYSSGEPDDPRPCSPARVQWQMARQCRALDIAALGAWCDDNEWNEDHADDPRGLIERESWLSPYVPPGT
jgi:hypothetical protein